MASAVWSLVWWSASAPPFKSQGPHQSQAPHRVSDHQNRRSHAQSADFAEALRDPPTWRAEWAHDRQARGSHEPSRRPLRAVPCSWQATTIRWRGWTGRGRPPLRTETMGTINTGLLAGQVGGRANRGRSRHAPLWPQQTHQSRRRVGVTARFPNMFLAVSRTCHASGTGCRQRWEHDVEPWRSADAASIAVPASGTTGVAAMAATSGDGPTPPSRVEAGEGAWPTQPTGQ